ncbi:MAG: hypothetical protein R3F31_13635 [Verrucomicrobiales bacterium]
MESIKNIESLAERVPEDLEVLLELAETRADHARLLSGQHAAATACVEKGLGVTDSVGARLVSLEGALPAPVRRTHDPVCPFPRGLRLPVQEAGHSG